MVEGNDYGGDEDDEEEGEAVAGGGVSGGLRRGGGGGREGEVQELGAVVADFGGSYEGHGGRWMGRGADGDAGGWGVYLNV